MEGGTEEEHGIEERSIEPPRRTLGDEPPRHEATRTVEEALHEDRG